VSLTYSQIVLVIISYLVLWKLGVLTTPDNGQVVRLAKHFRHPNACIEILSANKTVRVSSSIYLDIINLTITRLPLKTLSSQGLALYTVRVVHQPELHSSRYKLASSKVLLTAKQAFLTTKSRVQAH
jgi:hypothetical protein